MQMREGLAGQLRSDAAVLTRPVDDRGEDTTPSQHPADVAFDLYAREELVAEEVTLEEQIREIDEALARVATGAYGVCIDCAAGIPDERLAARPQAARCIACQRRAER